jgi:hypothetical protein
MAQIELVDDTWIDVSPATVAGVVSDPLRWRSWWPDLVLAVDELRGPQGVRWLVPSTRNGTLAGSMEIWLEPVGTGTLAHYFLRLDRVGPTMRRRERDRLMARYRVRAKQVLWSVADELDPGRLARIADRGRRLPDQ